MVDRDFMPLGFALAWLRPEGSVTIHAYYGEWLKTYPKDILRGMKVTMDRLREAGIDDIYAIADERVPGSDTLIKFFRGVPTGQYVPDGHGEYYHMRLSNMPI